MSEAEINYRLDRIEADMVELQRMFKSSVDDFKATLKSEISEIKSEQIHDLRETVKENRSIITNLDKRLREAENNLRDWTTGRSIFTWLLRSAIAFFAAIAGFIGGNFFKHPWSQ